MNLLNFLLYINKKKFSIENSLLLPDASILDPKLSFTCSKKQKITSAVDALCQSIESLWSLNSTHLSIKYAKKSFKLVWGNIYDAIINKSFDSHAKLLIGSNYSGKAINISKQLLLTLFHIFQKTLIYLMVFLLC